MMKFKDHSKLMKYLGTDEYRGDVKAAGLGLTSLEGCPGIIDGNFWAYDNSLDALVGGPTKVSKTYSLLNDYSSPALKNLDGVAKQMDSLNLSMFTNLTSIDTLAECQVNNLYITHCEQIKSFAVIPPKLESLVIRHNNISSLDGICCSVENAYNNAEVDLDGNNLTTLVDIHKHFPIIRGSLDVSNNPIESGFPYVFFIKNLKSVRTNNSDVGDIINDFLPLGKAGLVKCQVELLKNGLDQYARM